MKAPSHVIDSHSAGSLRVLELKLDSVQLIYNLNHTNRHARGSDSRKHTTSSVQRFTHRHSEGGGDGSVSGCTWR